MAWNLSPPLSWSYFADPHAASSAYCAMAIEVAFGGDMSLYNPYAPRTNFPRTAALWRNISLGANSALEQVSHTNSENELSSTAVTCSASAELELSSSALTC
eukprot:4026532-Prymnesium_polylepis.1